MKKGDFIWIAVLSLFIAILAVPSSRETFIHFTSTFPLLGGFLKFALLASMGELLAIRITTGNYIIPKGMHYRALIWGFLGIVITLIFNIYAVGISTALKNGLLPGGDSKFLFAFFTSAFMNLTFAPTFMTFHRFTDTIIDIKYERVGEKIAFADVLEQIDWYGMITFVFGKTIPLFWIPAHTVTFLLPGEYRVITAAFLSIALGAILAFSKKRKTV